MAEKDRRKTRPTGTAADPAINPLGFQKALKKQSVIRSALAMAAGTFSSRILGFVRDAVMFALFPRAITDAYVVAFRLPNMFRRLLGEGSLSVSFIPVYVDARAG
ncbi:MAG: lipid II flippase MurJ, partial [Bdellovibrionales bacterium]